MRPYILPALGVMVVGMSIGLVLPALVPDHAILPALSVDVRPFEDGMFHWQATVTTREGWNNHVATVRVFEAQRPDVPYMEPDEGIWYEMPSLERLTDEALLAKIHAKGVTAMLRKRYEASKAIAK